MHAEKSALDLASTESELLHFPSCVSPFLDYRRLGHGAVKTQQHFRRTCCTNPLFLHRRRGQKILRNRGNYIREYTVLNSESEFSLTRKSQILLSPYT